ncbi:acyl-CoA dehydrogenase family protein [Thermodesulfobacteriota bacterium]
MEFTFNKEEEDIRRSVNDFSRKELVGNEFEKLDHIPMTKARIMGDLGFIGLKVSEEYGGEQASWVEAGIVAEEIAKGNITMAYFVLLSCEMGLIIETYGSEEIKKEWLEDICRGKKSGCISVTEPSSGSDFGRIKTMAIRQGDHYLLNGDKGPTSFGMQADYAILFAKTTPETGIDGITAFLVPLDFPGISKKRITNTGLLPATSAHFSLDNVKVPQEYRIGEEGEGFYIHTKMGLSCNFHRILSGLIPLGTAQSALALATSYSKKRNAFGRPIAQFQAISGKAAEDATMIEMGKWLCYRGLWLMDQGLPNTKEAAMCSLWAPKSAYRIVENALLVHGHAGYSDDHPIQQMLRDTMAFEMIGGTEEMMKLVISRNMMGEAVIPQILRDEFIC